MKCGHIVFFSLFVLGSFLFGDLASASQAKVFSLSGEFERPADISVWKNDFSSRAVFSSFEESFKKGGYLASGDIDADGLYEIILGSGPGRQNSVRIYRQDGTFVREFRAYAEWFAGGVRVAVGDIDGDGIDEIITAPGPGMAPLIHVFNEMGEHKLSGGIHAYAEAFAGGVHVATGDLNSDGIDEIITAPGPGGGPHIRIWNGKMENIGKDFFAFDATMQDGVTIDTIKTPWGDHLIAGTESWSGPFIRRFSVGQNGARLDTEFYAFASSSHSGVRVASFDLDGDGYEEIIATQNGGTTPEVRMYDVYGTLYKKYLLHDPTYKGALTFAKLPQKNGSDMLASVALEPVVFDTSGNEKSILVSIAEQRLYAFERGRIAREFLISSGTYQFPTPIVQTSVLEKIPIKRYRWNYGPGNPNNYDLPNVKWNLRIYGPIYIHGAYWHNNFGNRMSHGCINVDYQNAEWIYNWADIGIPVETKI